MLYEAEYESEQFLGSLLSKVAPVALRVVGGLLGESEGEFEFEDFSSGEFEQEYRPTPMTVSAALMEHLAHAAAASESEAEAEALIGALVPLAAKVGPATLSQVAPPIIQGASKLGKLLYRSPKARPLLRSMPAIIRGAMDNLAGRAAQGKPITEQAAWQSLATQTARVFGNPETAAQTMKRSRIVHAHKCPHCGL